MMVAPVSLPPVEQLAELDAIALGAALAPLFEDASVVAPGLAAGYPFPSWDALLDRAERIVHGLGEPEQIALLAAHPRLGEAPERLRARSLQSLHEQRAVCGPGDTAAWLDGFNAAYELRFGFRFVEFVNGRSLRELVAVCEARLANDRQTELVTGVAAVIAIARDRLRRLGAGVS
jgi:2-oxo-4-hydroxy-4-carboxy--5-ureidoimidazoline (OHCU) decarboxylase